MNSEFWNNLIFHEEESNRGELLTAALLEVGGVRYPKFGNILILAGGSGSGKGHQLKNLIGVEGKILDIDRLKELALQHYGIRKTLQQKFGINVDDASNFKDPEFTGKVHKALKQLNLKERLYNTLNYIADLQERKPNLIFDVTLSDFGQFRDICDIAKTLHYDLKNIHVVWVLNTIEIALEQNSNRERVVPEEVVRSIFKNVSSTLKEICTLGSKLNSYMDGDIWVSFNRIGVDVEGISGSTGKGFFYTKANMFKIKPAGGSVKFPVVEGKELTEKIYEYTKDKNWLP